MLKPEIIAEIRRTAEANGGSALGSSRFEDETSIRHSDWSKYWARWGDAVREAGFEPNQLQAAYDADHLLSKYAELALELGRLPVRGELRLKRTGDNEFPSWNTFSRLGTKREFTRKLAEFCEARRKFARVVDWCNEYLISTTFDKEIATSSGGSDFIGYVYLLQHGSRREFKIGRTNNTLRRHGEIGLELPHEVEPIHVIKTDDPSGVEAYWHRRFADQRLKNEWFALSSADVQAFKRWKRIW